MGEARSSGKVNVDELRAQARRAALNRNAAPCIADRSVGEHFQQSSWHMVVEVRDMITSSGGHQSSTESEPERRRAATTGASIFKA